MTAAVRQAGEQRAAKPVVVILNMTPEPRPDYRVGLPSGGRWAVLLDTDAATFGGSGAAAGMAGVLKAEPSPSHGLPASIALLVPPLGCLVLRHQS